MHYAFTNPRICLHRLEISVNYLLSANLQICYSFTTTIIPKPKSLKNSICNNICISSPAHSHPTLLTWPSTAKSTSNTPAPPASSTGSFSIHLTSVSADDQPLSLTRSPLPGNPWEYHSLVSTPLARTHDILLAATHFPICSKIPPYAAHAYRCALTQCTPLAPSKALPKNARISARIPLQPVTTSAPARSLLMPQTFPFLPLVASRDRQQQPLHLPLLSSALQLRLVHTHTSILGPSPTIPLRSVPSVSVKCFSSPKSSTQKSPTQSSRRSRDGTSLTGPMSSPNKRIRLDGLASNRLSNVSVLSGTSTSPDSKENKRLSSASVRTF